jgi:hypothetical protein
MDMRSISSVTSLLVVLVACGKPDSPASGSSDGGTTTASAESSVTLTTVDPTTPTTDPTGVESSESSPPTTSGVVDEGSTTAAPDMGGQPVDPCTASATAFCEHFDDYVETGLSDAQTFGPWRASVSDEGATMDLDGTHTVSGDGALHVLLAQGPASGGRLFTTGDVPILSDTPTHVYGRMMMYIEQNGTSVHWTFFGVQGAAEPASPLAGNYAAYIMSSLPREGVNTYSFVDGLAGGDYYQDCSTQGETPMPTGEWTCVSFEMDSLARHLRMWKDGDEPPIVAVDDHGNGCVSPAPSDSTWWGPEIDELFVGIWSFHPMNAPLEVWIDDLVVDTVPVECP